MNITNLKSKEKNKINKIVLKKTNNIITNIIFKKKAKYLLTFVIIYFLTVFFIGQIYLIINIINLFN